MVVYIFVFGGSIFVDVFMWKKYSIIIYKYKIFFCLDWNNDKKSIKRFLIIKYILFFRICENKYE